MKYRNLLQCLSICVFMALVAAPGWAKYTPKIGVQAEKDGTAYLLINGRAAIHVMTPNGTLTPVQRATIAAERLSALVQAGLDVKSLAGKQVGRNVRIMAGETMVMVATRAEARAHGTSALKLAQAWVQNLQKLLLMPPLGVNPSILTIPMGESRSAAIECALSSPIQFEVSDPSLVSVDFKKEPGHMVVSGHTVGDAVVTLRCEEYSVTVNIAVRKYAASAMPVARKAIVTGYAAPGSMILSSARNAACQSVYLEPGARVNTVTMPAASQDLAPGQKLQVPVLVEAVGAGYLPRKIAVPVEVENARLPHSPPAWIMYSNNPEQLKKFQTLFIGRLDSASETTRLLYHHQNMMDSRAGFVIDLVNPTKSPAQVHVIEGVAEPSRDTVIVGYSAGLEFIRNQRSFTGRVYEIPPQTRQVLVSQTLGHEHTASGIMELRLVSGELLLVRVTAEPEDQRVVEDSSEIPVPASGIDPQRIVSSDHVYPKPIQDYEVTYTAGKSWVFLRLGKDALKHATQDMLLYGNYGVTYDIKAKIENPLSEPVTAEIAFEATAGPASGIFIVDGNLVRVRYLTPPTEARIGRVTVPAGKTKIVSISTIPLSGSAYPATLIIRPVGALRAVGGR